MIQNENLSMKQMYRLFGSENLDLEYIFAVLLFSITPFYIPKQMPGQFTSDDFAWIPPFLYLKEAKNELPKYLKTEASTKELSRIEAKLRLLQVEEKELETIPWYKFGPRFVIRKKYRSLRKEMVPVKTVFQYLEYIVQKKGMDLEKFYKRFKEFADGFPMNV